MGQLTICEGIARQEGWLSAISRCRRNHNPGNIMYGTFVQRHGSTGPDPDGYAIFPDDQAGFNAESELLEAVYCGLTLAQAIQKWAPASAGNPTASYIEDMCRWTGLQAETVLTSQLLLPPNLSVNS